MHKRATQAIRAIPGRALRAVRVQALPTRLGTARIRVGKIAQRGRVRCWFGSRRFRPPYTPMRLRPDTSAAASGDCNDGRPGGIPSLKSRQRLTAIEAGGGITADQPECRSGEWWITPCITQLRRIESHKDFAIIAHDSLSLLEALPGHPG